MKVKVKQDFIDDPLRVKPGGARTWFALILLVSIAMSMCLTESQMRLNTELKQKQLELAKKQYQLDSLKFEYLKKHQK